MRCRDLLDKQTVTCSRLTAHYEIVIARARQVQFTSMKTSLVIMRIQVTNTQKCMSRSKLFVSENIHHSFERKKYYTRRAIYIVNERKATMNHFGGKENKKRLDGPNRMQHKINVFVWISRRSIWNWQKLPAINELPNVSLSLLD